MSSTSNSPIDIYLRLVLLSLLIFWCLTLIFPFLSIVVWAIILALALSPLYVRLLPKFGNKKGLTSTVIVLLGLIIIIIPSWLFVDSIIEGTTNMIEAYKSENLTIPPPNAEVAEWPLVGKSLYNSWSAASANLQEFILSNKATIETYGKRMLDGVLGIGASIFQFIFATIIAGVLLVTAGTKDISDKIFIKILGPRGKEFSDVALKTVNSVVKGVLGVAFIQAFLLGIGFLMAGIPYAGVWALVALIMAILQLPVIILVLPIIIYLFSITSTTVAILWSVYLLLAGLSDNLLKPILLGKGASVPMLVIFLGVLGGFITMGFVGLFIGAIVLSVGYILLLGWINEDSNPERAQTIK